MLFVWYALLVGMPASFVLCCLIVWFSSLDVEVQLLVVYVLCAYLLCVLVCLVIIRCICWLLLIGCICVVCLVRVY